jgi:Ca-activated chloride channel homolog
MQHHTRSVILVLAVLAWTAGESLAGFIFFEGSLKNNTFSGRQAGDERLYEVRYVTALTSIKDRRVETSIRETIMAPRTEGMKVVGLFPLVPQVPAKDVEVLEGVTDLKHEPIGYKVLNAKEAEKLYQDIAKATGNADIVAYIGWPAVVLPEVTLDRKTELEVRFTQELSEHKGLMHWRCPMPSSEFSRKPVDRVILTANIENEEPLHSIFSTSHDIKVSRDGDRKAKAQLSVDGYAQKDAFQLLLAADRDPLGARLITHRAEGEEDGYFMLLAHPCGDALGKPIEKDVILALDVSGSMRGEKMEQARSAIEYCLDHLNPGDRFNVIAFGTAVQTFREGLIPNSEKNLHAARAWVDDLVAYGRTNIDGALRRGLAGSAEEGRLRIMLFLTDGTPTSGEMIPEKIIENLPEINASSANIYVVGVGHDVNAHLLDRIAEESDGQSEYIAPEEEIDEKVAALYNRLSHPVLSEVTVELGELNTHSVYPRKLLALFKGGDVMIMGRYRGGGKETVAFKGFLAGAQKRFAYDLEFAKDAEPEHDYVALLWASRKIGFLLQEIRLHGENEELTDEVIRLSKQYGIVTEYTEFIARTGGALDAVASREEAELRIRSAHAQKGGQWAVQQAENDQFLQQKTVSAAAANVYRDRRGKLKKADNIKQVGRRIFYMNARGQWAEANQDDAAPVREVKRFSEEYFELIRKDKDFARAQALGKEVNVKVGTESILVK